MEKETKVITDRLVDTGPIEALMHCKRVYLQLSPEKLVKLSLKRKEGILTDTGALMCDTGNFTGRSPKDRFIVLDALTREPIHWSDINLPYSPDAFDTLHQKMLTYLKGKEVFVRYASVGAEVRYEQRLMISSTLAWQSIFCHHLFIRPGDRALTAFHPDWSVICIPEFEANPTEDRTRQGNFTIINFTKKIVLIGGSAYAGEIKKAMFTVMNFLLPTVHQVLPMHCSANVGKDANDQAHTALFFGLSGTGKTTLSADASRQLIGDDEHGWSQNGIFNFEGGCYAKVVNLTSESEPEIFQAIRTGTVLENTRFYANTLTVDFQNISVTENTRTAYPLDYIPNACHPSIGPPPQHIFFLTADAFGVLPPLSRLTNEQAMFYFKMGYTAKLAGTEMGVNQPVAAFSSCFGEAFLPLHPDVYARMLGDRLEQSKAQVWLLNTGWISGPYGVGNRIPLAYTRALLHAVLDNGLAHTPFVTHPVFEVAVPQHCPNVPDTLLNPEQSWLDPTEYERKACLLKEKFDTNALRLAQTNKPIQEIASGSH
ncbi:phosphoenolpyruvate carboxykinase (ATP) [Dyadobacter jejuensis]|uniref:Phosphoenolpyruvate carboxykinase (ATP) n=1 Tax=Dyadobacter jejuensis TaxID=1082580 RepID=A0A316ABG9_9BACT|nr:phosphoenolpyruvate carboxykinase (ATP) [Dyadobacter jejuensis]PWJ54769.1 phosphoenolpyruvate carboxykinase (ATP) [Dyadobacter jejuensis]